MEYHFKIHKEAKGYWAECIELDGCHTQGETLEELKFSASEVLNLFLSEDKDSKIIFPGPKAHTGKNIIAVEVNPGVAFALLIRQARLKNKLTQHQMKDALGIKNLSNYQRLEDPKKANPELKTIISVIKKFPDIEFGQLVDSYKTNKKKVS